MPRAIRGIGESATNHAQSVDEIRTMLSHANASTFPSLERSLKADTRKGVIAALNGTRKRIQKQQAEQKRLDGLYAFQQRLVGVPLQVLWRLALLFCPMSRVFLC